MPQRLFVETGCRRLDQGGAEAIRDWVEERALPSHDRRRRVQQDPRGAGRPGAIISCTLTFNAVETITSDVMSWRAVSGTSRAIQDRPVKLMLPARCSAIPLTTTLR